MIARFMSFCKPGVTVYSLVKATSVSVRLRSNSFRLRSANKLSGTVVRNGSNTRFRVSQPYDFSSYPMEFSSSYPVVSSSEYLEPPPSCHPIISDGYEIRPSLVAMFALSPSLVERMNAPMLTCRSSKRIVLF